MTKTPLAQYPLKNLNTFGIDVKASWYLRVETVEELREALCLKGYPPVFILGGGSNMLLTGDLDALVIHLDIKGREIIAKDESQVFIKVSAGENWHETVLWSLEQDLGGLENMALIPGNSGSAPIQNIGAYGREIKDVFHSCDVIDRQDMKLKTLMTEDCQFGYRDSVFKREGRERYIITSLIMKLDLPPHRLHTSYGSIKQELEVMGVSDPTVMDVAKAVIRIRQSKLPDPAVLGNSGSFFKNPSVESGVWEKLKIVYPDMPGYEVGQNQVKLAAGWLIESCGLKGLRRGDAGVHERQALVLVNYGNASGKEVLELAQTVQEAVLAKFGIALEPEVNIL